MDDVRHPDDQLPIADDPAARDRRAGGRGERSRCRPLPLDSVPLDPHPEALAPPSATVAVPLIGFDGALAPMAAVPLAPPRKPTTGERLAAWHDEFWAWIKTLASAAVYATLIVTFGFQVARVEGLSMAPTLDDQDRLIVNKLVYRLSSPRRSDIVMLYYPLNPEKSFVKRVIAEEGDQVRIVDGRVFVNDVPLPDDYVPRNIAATTTGARR